MFEPTRRHGEREVERDEKKSRQINSQTLLNTDLFKQKILLCELNSAVQKRLINLNLIFLPATTSYYINDFRFFIKS